MSTKDIVYKKLHARTKIKFDDSSNIYKIGIDSLDLVDMITDFEKELKIKISDSDLLALKTVGDVVDVIDKSLSSKNKK